MSGLLMVPLDGSELSEQALPVAVALARRDAGRLHLVLVRSALPLDDASTAGEQYLDSVADRIERELPGQVTHSVLTDELGPLEFPPPASRVVATLLAREAEERDAALVVMTTHGHGGLRRAWLGSVTDSLIRLTTRPILLVRPEEEAAAVDFDRGFRHILIALDGSAAAERVVPFATEPGKVFGARYTLLRVVSPLTWEASAEMYTAYPVAEASTLNRQAAVDYLERIAANLRATGTTVAAHVVMHISPAAAITEYAAANEADLIALSTAGAGGVRRLLLGSVADKLVRSADVPVLVCNFRRLAESAEASAATVTAG